MCGIFGTINLPVDMSAVGDHLYHRGPDAQTTWGHDKVQLHHFRLSILDAEGGAQPMQRGPLVAVFNGELYNHVDVRQRLNLKCTTDSDTETLLAAFEKHGTACLDEFDGMFAFAIYNKKTKKLVLARDRAGKKPLYVYRTEGTLVFSSELKALARVFTLEPDLDQIDQFFKGSFIGGHTAYQNVLELCGGEYMLVDASSCSVKTVTWWSINDLYGVAQGDDYQTTEAKVKEMLTASVRRRLLSSDLEVGAFLSGGIDSGLVVAAASKITTALKTFTVSMPGSYDESDLAALVAKKCGTDHHVIDINFDRLKEDFYDIVTNYGEPFPDSSAIPSYYVAKEAKRHLTVILTGDGADELFAGYRRYVPSAKIDFYRNRGGMLWRLLHTCLPSSHNKESAYNRVHRLLAALSNRSPAESYWSLTLDMFQSQKGAYVQQDTANQLHINQFAKRYEHWSGLDKQMALDFKILLSGILLKKMDIATMAHSLEGRSPFLCKELLEYIPTISPKYKIDGVTTKVVLRNIAKQWLPETLSTQPKRGFEIPLKSWMDRELRGFVQDFLGRKILFVEQFIRRDYIDDLVSNKARVPGEIRAKMLYQLLVTEMWAHDNSFT